MPITLSSNSDNTPIGYLDGDGDLVLKRTDIEGDSDEAVMITRDGSRWTWYYDADDAVQFIYPGDSVTIQF